MTLKAGMVVTIVGTGEVGVLMQVRESSQTCVIKLNNGTLKKSVPLDDVEEASDKKAPNEIKSPIRLQADTTTAFALPSKAGAYEVGQDVLARFKRSTKYFPGKITKARANGTYDIEYEDGDVETSVDPSMIMPALAKPKSPKKQVAATWEVGDAVQARYKGGKKLYSGKVTKAHADGTYDIKYEDGDVETRVHPSLIEAIEDVGHKQKSKGLVVGAAVQARYKGGKKLYRGNIQKVHSDGTYDVKYEDGDVETRVEAAMIELVEEAEATESPKKTKNKAFKVGESVQARYHGGKRIYSGKITRAHADGTYDIKYDDGEVESRIDAALIEGSASPSAANDKSKRVYEVGDVVQARYKGGKKLYKGKITRVHSDGSYDIKYEDGDVETRVDQEMIASSDSDGATSPKHDTMLQVGDAVQAPFKGGKKLYSGTIAKRHSDNTYDVRFDDGDTETRVPFALIVRSEPVSKPPKSKTKKTPSVGTVVQARYKGGKKLYKGKITRARLDGTFDIQYEDGDVEQRVGADMIVLPDDGSDDEADGGGKQTAASPKKTKKKHLDVGDPVQAHYKGGKKLYGGKIMRVHSDGTYDVKYDDGDVETRVPLDMIEVSEDASDTEAAKKKGKKRKLEVGLAVQARYKGGKKLYPGKIHRVHSDGSCDVKYDDGDVETRLDAAMIVIPDDNSDDEGGNENKPSSPKKKKRLPKSFESGDVVRARYKGGKKLYRGKITRAHSDGTYDIKYEDGDVETRVGPDMIDASDDEEEATSTSKPSKPKSLAVGDAVQAKYKGGKKLYSGKITRVHADGTYDIKYEDGDVETRVSKANIVAPEDAAAPSGSPTKSQQRRVLAVGDIVQARYKGGKKLYKGEIKRVRSDGTYDIEYEDGDVETRVDPAMITADDNVGQDSDMEASSKKRISAGDAVQARYKGGKKLYHGKVLRVHSDGTLDIQYEDGDVERRVDPAMVVDNSAKSESKRSPTVGETVQARYKGGKKLYPGKVIRAHSDGTFDIQYEDGDVEKRVKASNIVVAGDNDGDNGATSPKKTKRLEVGTVVHARYKGGKKLYRGKVTRAHSDGTYDIKYEDGDVETHVGADMIDSDDLKPAATSPKSNGKPKPPSVGTVVQARYKGGKKLYKGKITRARLDGTFDIQYEDGDVEQRVGADMIVLPDDGSDDEADGGGKQTAASPKKTKKKHLDVGDPVQAHYKGGKKLYGGKIMRVHSDGTYDVKYDDGDVETRVPLDMIEVSEDASDTEAAKKKGKKRKLEVGLAVQARYKGGKKLYPGKIHRVHSDGSCDVKYDDGDVETRLDAAMIVIPDDNSDDEGGNENKPSSPKKKKRLPKSFESGDVVRARYKGGKKLYRGKITRAHSDGTYDIKYEDGDVETRVGPDMIDASDDEEEATSTSKPSKPKSLAVGDAVQAKYKGGKKLYSGKITRVHADGTYDIKYEDGDVETRVSKANIVAPEDAAAPSGSPTKSQQRRVLAVGDIVQARYKGGKKLYKGEIKRVRSDGTYDIEYEDGDVETRVDPAMITADDNVGQDSDMEASSKKRISAGDAVQARYKGGKKLYHGKVLRVHSDGTLDIQYEDGDVERRVDPAMVVDNSAKSESKRSPTVGETVQARYKGGKKLYPGKVIRAHSDGTFDIQYEDGDVEKRVEALMIVGQKETESEEKGTGSSAAEKKSAKKRSISVGDTVQARYKGGKKLYRGEVIKVHSDNSYDIRYDDGDIEKRVESTMIAEPVDSDAESEAKTGDKAAKKQKKLSVGRTVQVRLKGGKKLYSAKVVKVHSDGTYAVEFDDGDIEKRVGADMIIDDDESDSEEDAKPQAPDNAESKDHSGAKKPHAVGSIVQVNRDGGKSRSRGKITRVRADDTFDIRYDDGETEKRIPRKLIHADRESDNDSDNEAKFSSPKHTKTKSLAVESVVQARYKGGKTHYRGKIVRVRSDGSYDIRFDDGDVEEGVNPTFVVVASSDDATRDKSELVGWSGELQPVAFVAAVMFSQGEAACRRHGDVVRRLCVGRTPDQIDMILRFKDAFESFVEENDYLIPTARLESFVAKVTEHPTKLRSAISSLQKRAASVSLAEVFAVCGFLIDELASVPTIQNAVAKLRIRLDAGEVRRVITLVRNVCLKVLRFPNNSDYWRLRADSPAFLAKLGRVEGATALLEACGFSEYNHVYYELRGVRTSSGKRISALSKHTLDQLRENCALLESELSSMDGVDSVLSVITRISKEREAEVPLSIEECRHVLRNVLTYVENILKNPKDSRCWRIREANKVYQRQVGYLPFATDLMDCIGFERVSTSQGFVLALKGTWVAGPDAKDKTASLSNFSFSRISERSEWFLWRRKQEIETLLEDDMSYLAELLPTSSVWASSLKPRQSDRNATMITRMYPYGRNVMDLFSKTSVQRAQLDMIRMVFAEMDCDKKEFLDGDDFHRSVPNNDLPVWAKFDAYDIDHDGKIDFTDFVAAFGPCLDHSFDVGNAIDIVPFEKMSLCERVSAHIGQLRLRTGITEALYVLERIAQQGCQLITNANKTDLWKIKAKSELGQQLHKHHAAKELLLLFGFREVDMSTNQQLGSEKEFVLRTQSVRFNTSKDHPSMPQSLDNATVSRIETIVSIISGHCRCLRQAKVADVGAVSRAIGLMKPVQAWIKLTELAVLCVNNVLTHPQSERYRVLTTSSHAFTSIAGSVRGGVELLLSIGFRETDRGALALPFDTVIEQLKARKLELEAGLWLLRAQDFQVADELDGADIAAVHSAQKNEQSHSHHSTIRAVRDHDRRASPNKPAAAHRQPSGPSAAKRERPKTATPNKQSRLHGSSKPSPARGGNRQPMSITEEILAELSPRATTKEDRRVRTAPTTFAGRNSGGRGSQKKATQRRHPASATTSSESLHLSLGLATQAGADTIMVKRSNALERGCVIRIGSECNDLVEERTVVNVKDSHTLPNLAAVELDSQLSYFHPVKELAFIKSILPSNVTRSLHMADLRRFIACDVLSDIISAAVGRAVTHHPAGFDGKQIQKKTIIWHADVLANYPAATLVDACSRVQVCRRPLGIVITTPSKPLGLSVNTILDSFSTSKLRAIWNALTMEAGVSNVRVRVRQLREAFRKDAYLCSLLAGLSLDEQFGRFDNENYLVGYEELIDMLRLREIIHEPPSKTCVNDPMQLAVLKQAFQHLQSQPSNGWKTVHLKSLITSAKTTLQQQMAVSRLNDADQAISDDNMLEKMQTVVKKIEVTWPEIEYVLRTKNPFTSVELFPCAAISPVLESSTDSKAVAEVVLCLTANSMWMLLFDCTLEHWRLGKVPELLGRSQLLKHTSEAATSRSLSGNNQAHSCKNQTKDIKPHRLSVPRSSGFTSDNLHDFKQQFNDGQLLKLCCHDQLLCVNTTMLEEPVTHAFEFYRAGTTALVLTNFIGLPFEALDGKRTRDRQSLMGPVTSFDLAHDGSVMCFVVVPRKTVLHLISTCDGKRLGQIDDFASSPGTLLFQFTCNQAEDVVLATTTRSSFLIAYSVPRSESASLKLKSRLVLRADTKKPDDKVISSLDVAGGGAIVASYSCGFIAIWTSIVPSKMTDIVSADFTFQVESPGKFLCKQVFNVPVTCPTRSAAFIYNRCRVVVEQRDRMRIRELERQLQARPACVRLVHYVFEDGQVISIPVQSFSDAHATLNDAALEIGLLNQHTAFRMVPVEESSKQGVFQVILQRASIARVGFFVCAYVQDGIFSDRSMNEIVAAFRSQQLMLKPKSAFEKFAQVYQENVDMQLLMFFTKDDGDGYQRSGIDDCMQSREIQPPLVLGTLLTPVQSANPEGKLSFWSIQRAQVEIGKRASCSANDAPAPSSEDIKQCVAWQSSTLLDAARVQMMRCGVDEDLEATIATEERFQIIRNVKAEMFRLVGSSTSQPEIANALLVLLQQFCLNGSRNRFICKTIDPFFRRIFDGCAKMTDTCSETSNSKLVPQDEFVASLQMNQERNVFYREWIAHVISLLNATTRRPDLAVAWKDVALVLRQINISFLRVEECADILVDLGLAGSSENRFPRLPALVHELLDALQCSRVESGVLVALPELVELLIKTNAFSSFFHTQWQALQTITEAAHAQHNDTFTVDNTYALYALCDHLNVSVNDSLSRLGDFQYRLEVHAADRTLKVAAPSINKLRALLKTPLPDIPVPVFTSLTLQTRSKTLRISDCVVFNALGVSGNAQPASNLTVIQSLLLNQPAPWDANILRFHQRIARVRAREYFLPILFSALDSPILLAGRGIDSAVSKATGLVTTSIDGWMSLADVVKHGSAALTTTGWTRLGYGWLYQVLLAMITIQNERFVLEQLRLEDILLSPDARAVRVSVVRGLRSVGEDESHDFVAQTRSYGLVAMRFLELVLAHGDDSHTFEQTLMVDALDDQLAQLHRRSAIQALKGFVQNGLEIQLDEYSSIAEVMAADIPCECMELVRLVKLILMALQPMPRACRLDVLWELVYDSAQIQVPDELTVDLMPHVRVQQALELQVLDPIERLVQLMATPRYQHCEGQRARLRTMSASLASLLAVWNDSIDKHLVSKPDDIGSQAISSVFLERVVAAKVVLKVAHAARALTVCLVHCDGVRACHTIVQQLLASLDHLLKSLNLVSLRAVIQRNWNVVALILQVLTAVGEFVTSQPSDIESDVTMTVPGSMTAVNGLWRLAEASLQRVLKSSDGAVDELCHLQAIMKKYAALPWHAFQARYEVRQSRLLTSHTARPSLLFWWTDSAPVMPRRVKPAIPTRLRSWCTDHSHLSTANRTFDIYFRLMCGIKVPKFRRAVVHEWFAPCFLERKVFAPLILPREPVATTWLIVRFDRLVLSLIHDPDEVVLLGAVSLLDILTRVLRFAPQRATRRPLPAVLVPAESTDARHILGCSAAQQLALQVGSEHVLVAVVCVLRRVVRALKLLGSSGVTERKGDRPHPLVATFWAICAYVVNCLHGGDRLTRCWSRAGLLHLILAHAKSNALTFLKPIDGNAIHELSQRHRHSHSRRGEAPWVAFTSFAPHDVATNASPFRLLMLEIMAVGSGSSVVMMKHLVNTSKFFRKEANLAASASSELLLRPLSLASAVDLCLHKSYGKVSHAFDLAAELESFDGSASEVEQLVKYATSIMELRKAMHPRDPISPLFHRLANKIWRWMKKNWQLAVLHGNASVHGRIVVAALRLLHAIVACESIESDERLSLMRWDDIRFPVGAGEEESAQESPTSCLTLVLNLVSSVVVESPEVTGATSENDQHIAISCVFELFARIAEMVVDRRELHLVVVDERTLDAALRVLRVSCRVDGGHVSYSLHHKWQLWVCLLRCASRHLAAAVVQNNFIGSHVFALLKADRTGGDVDISNENIVERRTEAIMLLESLVDEEHRLEVNNAAPDASVGIHVLREEAAKQALFHRTLPRERSLVSSCVTDRIGGQSASGIIATAVRVTQLLCCLAFDVASNALDPAFQADLESADVPAWVVEFHQRTVARDEDELAAVERRVQLFWKEWSVSSSPKPSTGGSDNVQIKTKDSVRGRARLLDNQRTARVPTRPQPPLATGLAILTSPSSVEVGRTSLNKLLAVLGDEVVNLERAFRTFAVGDDTNVNSAQLEEACLAPALAQLAVQAPVSLARKRSFGFRDFVKIYAQASGLEAAMAAQQQAHPTVPVRWIRASNGKWCCITSDEEAKLRICGEHTETSNAVDTEFAVRTLKNALGTIALAEVRTRVNALVRIDGKVSFDDVCRVFLKLQSDPRAKSALRLTLQGEDATTGERVKKRPAIEAILSPVQTKGTVKEASRAEKAGGAVNSDHVKRQDPMRQSTLDALLRVDVDSANVLSRVPRCVDDAASESMDSTAYAPASAQDESSSSSSDASSSESSQSTLPPRSRKSSAKPKPRRTKSAKATKRVQGSLSSDSSNNSSSDESKSVGAASSSSSQSSSTKRRRRKETQKRITSPRRSKGGGKTTRKPPNSEQKQRKTPRVVGLAQPTSETRLSPSEVLRVVFDRYDVDGDGVISFADLRRALHSGRKRLHVTDVEIQQWIAQKDRQGQGHVTFEDFVCEFQAKAQAQPAKSVAQAPAEGQRKTLMSTKRR